MNDLKDETFDYINKLKKLSTEIQFEEIENFIIEELLNEEIKEENAFQFCELYEIITDNNEECHLPLGFYGLDSPEILVEKIVKKMHNENKDL